MNKFFDPVPIVEEKFAKLRGIVTTGGAHDAVGACKFRGETIAATILGPTLAAGDSVSVVKLESGNYMMAASGDYHSTARIELSEWAKKFPANLALRMLMDDNPKDYLYRRAHAASYDSTAKTAVVGEPYNCVLPVKFGAADGTISAGPCLVCEVENTKRHVISIPDSGILFILPGETGQHSNVYSTAVPLSRAAVITKIQIRGKATSAKIWIHFNSTAAPVQIYDTRFAMPEDFRPEGESGGFYHVATAASVGPADPDGFYILETSDPILVAEPMAYHYIQIAATNPTLWWPDWGAIPIYGIRELSMTVFGYYT